MSRYYGHVLLIFTDGTTDRVGGNRTRIEDGVLTVLTARVDGVHTDLRHFVIANVKSWRWEDK